MYKISSKTVFFCLFLSTLFFNTISLAQCSIIGDKKVTDYATPCVLFSGCTTIVVGDGSTVTNLTIDNVFDLSCLGTINFIIKNKATVLFGNGANELLKLHTGSNLIIENGGNISGGKNCTASDRIYIGDELIGTCNGKGQGEGSFADIVNNGGINAAGILKGTQNVCEGSTTAFSSTIATGTWSSSNNSIATVSATGDVTGVAAGTATISYTRLGAIATRSVTVAPKVTPTFNPVAPICSGAVLSALPTTSLENITGTWLPALNNTVTTTYTFTPTAGQCAKTTSLIITVNETPAKLTLSPIVLPCLQQTWAKSTWNSAPNATSYILDVSTDPNFGAGTFLLNYKDLLVSATATTTSEVINGLLFGQTYYLRVKYTGNCGVLSPFSNTVTISFPVSKTTDGTTWIPPLDNTKIAVFSSTSPLSIAADLNACSCIIDTGTNVVVQSGVTLTLENSLTVLGTGTLVFENEASLVQKNNVQNTGNIEYRRISEAMKNFDYTYWSSPVANQNIVALSPNTLSDKFHLWDPTEGWKIYNNATTSTMNPGAGYIIRVPKPGTYITFPEVVTAPTYKQPVTFKGVPNNGDIFFPAGADQYNLVGNPYPSAIVASKFIQDNIGIIYGPLYFWTHNTPITNNAYTSDDYATYNFTGGLATQKGNFIPEWRDANNNRKIDAGETTDYDGNGIDKGEWIDANNNGILETAEWNDANNNNSVETGEWTDANTNGIFETGEWTDTNSNKKLDLATFEIQSNIPSGNIAAGQSFFVGNAAAGNFVFNNAMRVTGNNDEFFKQTNTKKTASAEKNRIWLDLTNSGGAFKQLLIGYLPGATNDWDNLYDGPSFDGQIFIDFYSINKDQNLAIQGRALPFEVTDVVPLGYRSDRVGTFEISIDNREGQLEKQIIWLEDKKTRTLHDLTQGKYTFTAIKGVENDRFVLKYSNPTITLGTNKNEVNDTTLMISAKNKKITLTASEENIAQVQVYDVLGRKCYDNTKINAKEWSITTIKSSNQVLIVKTTLTNGTISSKKIIF